MPTQEEPGYFFILIAIIAALSGILFGYDTGVISGAILFIKDEFSLTSQTNGVVVSSVLFGALLGAIISGRLVDQLGRKLLLITDAVIFILGTLVSASATSLLWLILGRIVVGLAIGIASYVAPLYISEIAPTKHRGALVSLNQLAITLGILLSYIVDYICVQHGGWRWMFVFGVVPAIGLFIGMFFLPESPRWLCAEGDVSKAAAILKRTQGEKAGRQELENIQASLTVSQGTWKMLFNPLVRSTVIIGVGLAIIQQVTGINTIIYYAPTIFTLAGFQGPLNAILATAGIGVIFVLSTIAALPFIDSIGRRPLLLLGLFGMTVSLAMLSGVFHQTVTSDTCKWIALASMLIYIACFGFSLGPIMWLMIAEIYPLKVRGLGSSLATAVNWASNMLVALTFLTLIEWCGAGNTFLIYCLLSMVSLLFVFFLVPETRHVSLEQIEENVLAGYRFKKLGYMQVR